MLKDKIEKNFREKENKSKDDNMSEDMNIRFRGELEIWAYKKGELIHHDKEHNIVTDWAKHSTMHLLTGESYSSHGNRTVAGPETAFTKREEADHTTGQNLDGTIFSGEQYLSDNTKYFDDRGSGDKYFYGSIPHPDIPSAGSDSGDGFVYPFFPTKMLFGTGIEYASWASTEPSVTSAGREGSDQDGYGHVNNGEWNQVDFDTGLTDALSPEYTNYYSSVWDGTGYILTRARTVNDIYSAGLTTTLDGTTFAVEGAIKDGIYDGTNAGTVLTDIGGKWFSDTTYRGIGRPCFIYSDRAARFMTAGSEVLLKRGDTIGTEHLESKLTFTVVMPEQSSGEFYPYNGYNLKVAGLFADASMLLYNTVPADNTAPENDDSDDNNLEYTSYIKQPGGILWAKRNIAPIYKSHDTEIIAQWTIYL